jgi:hypothetical protein
LPAWSTSKTPSHLLKNGHNAGPERELITTIAVVGIAARTLLDAAMISLYLPSTEEGVRCPPSAILKAQAARLNLKLD